MDNNPSNEEGRHSMGFPPLSHLDMEVLESLPAELFSELNETYGGKLEDFIDKKKKGKTVNVSTSSCTVLREQLQGATVKEDGSLSPDLGPASRKPLEFMARHNMATEFQETFVSAIAPCSETYQKVVIDRDDLLPPSLRQVDTTMSQQFPEEIRPHTQQECPSIVVSGPPLDNRITEDQAGSMSCVVDNNLWAGNPPHWIDKFKTSDLLILNRFAKLYYKAGPSHNLSATLQRMISESLDLLEMSCDGWDEAVCTFSELLKQFIKLQIETNLEELYVCFRILKRLMSKSKFFLEVYNIVLPYLQASVSETYRGSLELS